jgi:hypothetical protein
MSNSLLTMGSIIQYISHNYTIKQLTKFNVLFSSLQITTTTTTKQKQKQQQQQHHHHHICAIKGQRTEVTKVVIDRTI